METNERRANGRAMRAWHADASKQEQASKQKYYKNYNTTLVG